MSSSESLGCWGSFKLWNSENPSAKWAAIGVGGLVVTAGIVALSVFGGFEQVGHAFSSLTQADWINIGAPVTGVLFGVAFVKGIQTIKSCKQSATSPEFEPVDQLLNKEES